MTFHPFFSFSFLVQDREDRGHRRSIINDPILAGLALGSNLYGFAGHPVFFALGAVGGGSATPDRQAPLGSNMVAGHPLWVRRPPSFFFFKI
jgi:hypothetical protein